ncbi:MAG: hypothetical protein OXU23_09590 [Candidatus Poribacteria bacterium]|nr:hypothetical protein [Candidatus Poribacteria bacterium]
MPAHNHHPMVTSIILKEAAGKVRDDMVVVAADDNDAANGIENQFALDYYFDLLIVDAADQGYSPRQKSCILSETKLGGTHIPK